MRVTASMARPSFASAWRKKCACASAIMSAPIPSVPSATCGPLAFARPTALFMFERALVTIQTPLRSSVARVSGSRWTACATMAPRPSRAQSARAERLAPRDGVLAVSAIFRDVDV